MGVRDPYEGSPSVPPSAAARMVLAAAREGRGLSLIRLGDGEFPLLGLHAEAPRAQVDAHLDMWFGPAHPSAPVLAGFVRELRGAVRAADIVGLPRASRQRVDPCCGYVGRLFARHDLHRAGVTYTDCNVNYFFQLIGLFRDLLQDRRFLGVITCRDVGPHLRTTFGIGEVLWHPVPADFATSRAVPAVAHLPDCFEALRRDIAPPFPGAVYLVGAGPFGKVYCQWIRERGGVAVDIGSLFDGWAGVLSQPRLAQRQELFSLALYDTPDFAAEVAWEARMQTYRRLLGEIWFGITPSAAEWAFLTA